MKTSRTIFLMAAVFFFQTAVLACAGSAMNNTDHDTMMSDNQKMESSGTPPAQMQTMKPEKDTMMGDAMHDMAVMLSGSDGHHAAGTVSFSSDMGKDVLVLSDIKVDRVPDGHVYLAQNGDRRQGIDLGILHQFSGTVTFPLPPGINLSSYDSVIIFCKKFNVEIGRTQL
jgi:hypothetical protein